MHRTVIWNLHRSCLREMWQTGKAMVTAHRFEFAFNEGGIGLFSEMHELGILPDGSG